MHNIYKLIPLLTVILLVVGFGSVILTKSSHQALAQTDSFTFGAAGDYSSTSNTDAVFTTAKNSGVNFLLGIGDLSYDTQGSPAGWGTYVKNIIGTLPFVIIQGNHDASQIDQFVSALPDPMGSQGTYGKQFYFDYPKTSPVARFIMISPAHMSLDTAWLDSAIDSAKSSGIQWVIAGMHEPCITTGTKTKCESKEAVLTQLLTKKVDVILYGHEHNYQRSKQLKCAKQNSFDASCVVADGSSFTQGAGSVLAVVGMGGNSFYETSSSDSEAGYFATMNSDTYGILKFTVNKTQISAQFVKAAGGSFSDSFTISASTTTPSGTVPSGTAIVPSQVISSVPWNYLVPCPTCNGPSVVPLPSGSSVTGTVPSGTAVSPAPTDPCVTGEASIAHGKKKKGSKHSKHRNHRGEIGNWMESLLKFLIELINKLIERFGGTPLSPDILDEDQNPDENPVEEQPCDPVEEDPGEVPSGTITQPVTVPSSVPSAAPSTVAPSVIVPSL